MTHAATALRGDGASRLGNPSIWGDGFASDNFCHLTNVLDWRQCSDDELVFLFPSLALGAAATPERVHDWLNSCGDPAMSMSAQRSRGRGGKAESDGSHGLARTAARVTLGFRSWCQRSGGRFDRQTAGRRLCEDILRRLEVGELFTFDNHSSALFAFHSGLHPAYVGASDPTCYERDTVAGWLGHLFRGRAALVPLMLADYLIDMTAHGPGPGISMRDPVLARLAPAQFDWRYIRRAAEKRLSGEDPVLRLAGSWVANA